MVTSAGQSIGTTTNLWASSILTATVHQSTETELSFEKEVATHLMFNSYLLKNFPPKINRKYIPSPLSTEVD
jgi:hypothetical protein